MDLLGTDKNASCQFFCVYDQLLISFASIKINFISCKLYIYKSQEMRVILFLLHNYCITSTVCHRCIYKFYQKHFFFISTFVFNQRGIEFYMWASCFTDEVRNIFWILLWRLLSATINFYSTFTPVIHTKSFKIQSSADQTFLLSVDDFSSRWFINICYFIIMLVRVLCLNNINMFIIWSHSLEQG